MAKDPVLSSYLYSMLKPQCLLLNRETEVPVFVESENKWREFFRLAGGLRAQEQVAYVLKNVSWKDQIPESVRIEAESWTLKQKLKFSILQKEIDWAMAYFADAKIPVILSGSFDMASRFYSDRNSRPLSEIEFIVLPFQALNAKMALGKGDYRLKSDEGMAVFSRGVGAPNIILRTGIYADLKIDEEDMVFERAHVLGAPHVIRRVPVLSPTDVFVDLVHRAKNVRGLKQPILLNDLHFVTCSNSIDWEDAGRILKATRVAPFADLVLEFLSKYWDTKLPKEVQSRKWISPIRRKMAFRGKNAKLDL